MRLIKSSVLATALLMAANPSTGQQVECAQIVATMKSANAFIMTFNEIADFCKDKVATDPTCRQVATISTRNLLADYGTALAAQTLALAVQCRERQP